MLLALAKNLSFRCRDRIKINAVAKRWQMFKLAMILIFKLHYKIINTIFHVLKQFLLFTIFPEFIFWNCLKHLKRFCCEFEHTLF